MSKGFSKITILGNVGKDKPELRYTPNGKEVTDFSVAVNTGFGDWERTDWYNVTAWGKLAMICIDYLDSGSKVLVSGQMQKDTWETDAGEKLSRWKLVARDVVLLGGTRRQPEAQQPVQQDEQIPF